MLREGTRVGPRLRTHRRAGSPLGWILAFALLAAVATFLAAVPRSSAGLASGSDVASGSSAGPATDAAPARLADTGLYSDPATRTVAQENISYEPQYPLWSDGAVKRRWVHIPPGTHIDASDPDHWQFPIGTRFWKEFSFDGRPVETRFITRGDNGEWMYFAYRWNAEGTDAVLAPEQGIRSVVGIAPGVGHDIPSRYDCLACHEGRPERILGFTALQLSSDRDPMAPHQQTPLPGALDLKGFVDRGWIAGLPEDLVSHPPRVEASTPRERAALGYLSANCGICHNESGPLAQLGLSLEYSLGAVKGTRARALFTAVSRASRYQPSADPEAYSWRIAAGNPDKSLVVTRMSSRQPLLQMPPLGTNLVDSVAVALIRGWIRDDLGPRDVETFTKLHGTEDGSR